MSAMPKIRVLLADDHKLFRAGIRSLLQTLDDIEVVAEAEMAVRRSASPQPTAPTWCSWTS